MQVFFVHISLLYVIFMSMSNNIVEGIGVSDGISIGTLTVYRPKSIASKGKIWSDNVSLEVSRLQKARSGARAQLSEMYRKAISERGKTHADIINAYLTMLDDPEYIATIERLIITQSLCAEYAIASASDSFATQFASMEDEYMQARASDIRDVSERLIGVLRGLDSKPLELKKETILLADDLSPSETMQIDKSKVLAFVTKRGSRLSHSAILARSMGIPAIVGVEFSGAINGTLAIVDGYEGKLIIDPDEATIEEYKIKQQEQIDRRRYLDLLKGQSNVTADGKHIGLFANVGSLNDVDLADSNTAEGIGLLRTEFLYLDAPDYPSEEIQYNSYLEVAERMQGRPVVIRTLDIGADKNAPYMNIAPEPNPAMGMRGIRLSLGHKSSFKTQLRAIYRANKYGNISILVPMIISVEEVWQVKELMYKVGKELETQGIPYNPCRLGIMIETPAAACISDILANEVDFFSIGTNDLTQYMLAIDRQNTSLGFICDYHHEAVIRMIRQIIINAHDAGKKVCVCGEVAADTSFTEQLLRMGVDELSVAPSAILEVRDAIRKAKVKS